MTSSSAWPKPRTFLVGRDGEVAELVDLLRRGAERLITLTGVGGCGKTRLAEVARQLRDDFPDGVWFVDLTAVSDPEQVALRVTGVTTTAARAWIKLAKLGLRSRAQVADHAMTAGLVKI